MNMSRSKFLYCRLLRENGTVNSKLPFPTRNLVKGETDIYVPNLYPHRKPAPQAINEEEPKMFELTKRDQGHRTLADCYFKYKGREVGGFHSNATVINENLNPHLAERNIYFDNSPMGGNINHDPRISAPAQIFPRFGIQNQMRKNMSEDLRNQSSNSKLLGNHILELGGIEDTIGGLIFKKVMEDSLRNNELRFIGYQSDIRNILEIENSHPVETHNEHPYYSHNQKCKEVYNPFQYNDPYFRYKYHDPHYEEVTKGQEKHYFEPNGFYSTVSHGQYN